MSLAMQGMDSGLAMDYGQTISANLVHVHDVAELRNLLVEVMGRNAKPGMATAIWCDLEALMAETNYVTLGCYLDSARKFIPDAKFRKTTNPNPQPRQSGLSGPRRW